MYFRKMLVAAALLICTAGFSGAMGCGSSYHTRTVHTETVEAPDRAYDQPPAERSTTTTTTDDDSPGVIGSAAHLVWAAITLPFRVIGALF